MKKYIALILAALMALTSWGAMAQEALPDAARQMLPEHALLLNTQQDDDGIEYTYWHAGTSTLYEITLHPADRTLTRVESEVIGPEGARNVTLTETDICNAVLLHYPNARDITVVLHQDDGFRTYETRFVTEAFTARVTFHPETGEVTEQELDYTRPAAGQKPAAKNKSAAGSADQSDMIGKDRASAIAISKAGGGAVRFIKLDKDDGRMVYEGELVLGNYEYEFEIDAKTGAVRDWDKDRIDND